MPKKSGQLSQFATSTAIFLLAFQKLIWSRGVGLTGNFWRLGI
jgi:hypothetical protein